MHSNFTLYSGSIGVSFHPQHAIPQSITLRRQVK